MFHKIKRSLLTAALVLLPFASAQAMEPVMGSENLVPGMRGYAKTVILGRDIQTFDIEILGVIKNGRQSEGRILAKASGDVIEQSGGVLQGMSGSPVYINGYLIGAVSGGWKDIDNRICVITPIGDMLKIWQMPDEKSQRKVPQVDIQAAFAKKEAAEAEAKANPKEESIVNDILHTPTESAEAEESSESVQGDEAAAGDESEASSESVQGDEAASGDGAEASSEAAEEAAAENLATPLMVGGLSGSSLEFLRAQLEPYNMVPYSSGIGAADNVIGEATAIEPGSSVGVQLVRGDVSIGAIGTVTAVDGERVLAFGHSFMHRGNVGYFMTEADIISTASGVNNGFKIGVPGKAVGTINQDRESGVAGRLGYFPQVVPMQVIVNDKGTAASSRYDVQITYHEELLPALAVTVAYNAMEKSMDTATEGSVKIGFEIATNDGGGEKIIRDNMYYAPQSVSQLSISELADMLIALCQNTAKEADIYNIKVNVEIDNKRNTASIIEMQADKTNVKPGDTVKLTLKLKPYRREVTELVVPFTIPEGAEPGAVLLEARGGGLVSLTQMVMNSVDLSAEEDKNKTLEMTVKELTDKNKNNDILIDMIAVAAEGKAGSSKKSGDKAPAVQKPVKQSTDYIIDNVLRIGLTVEKK